MSNNTSENLLLDLPDKRPRLRRDHTASPPERSMCTPQTSHDFTPLGSTTPLPTPANDPSRPSSIDYFPLPSKENIMSPDAVVFEPHGFLPLCSVAPEAMVDEAGDCFSHTITGQNHDDQTFHHIAEEVNECIAEGFTTTSEAESKPSTPTTGPDSTSSTLTPESESKLSTPTPESNSQSTTPTPRLYDSIDTSIIPIDQLIHPTDSPVYDRETVPSPDLLWKSSRLIRPKLRGGGVYDPNEAATDLERQRCIPTQSPIHDVLDRLEDHDQSLSRAIMALEDAVSKLEEAMVHHFRLLERISSPASALSNSSASVYSCEETRVDFLMDGKHSQDEPSDDEETVTGDVTGSSDTDSDDTEYHTAPSHSRSEPSRTPSPAAYQATALRHSLLLDIQPSHPPPPPPRSPNALQIIPVSSRPTNTSLATTISPYPSPPTIPLTLYRIASHTSPRLLSTLLSGPKVSLINSSTRSPYVSAPVAMLLHFCGESAISRLLPTNNTAGDVLEIPASEAEYSGTTRVIRFMKRCCLPASHASIAGEMRIPQGDLSAGIETIRACKVLNLHADADRIEGVIVREWLAEFISPEDIEIIWNGYGGSCRDGMLGDAVVWFVLREMAGNEEGLREVLMWMLELEEYRGLKERVRVEVGGRKWRGESREVFLRRVRRVRRGEREERVKETRGDRVRGEKGRRKLRKEEKIVRSGKTGVDLGKTSTEVADSEVASSSTSGLEGQGKSAKQLYAEYARSLTPALVTIPPRQGIRKTCTIFSTSSSSLPIEQGSGSSTIWADPGDDPGPCKKRSLWEKLKLNS